MGSRNAERPALIGFCGLPGSGKSTLEHEVEKSTGAVRTDTDEWVAGLGVDFFDDDVRIGPRPTVRRSRSGQSAPRTAEYFTGHPHLTAGTAAALDRLRARGFRFTVAPPKIRGAGTFTVRAFATLEA